ncbi:MAG TPA: dethiobiotin synthase [Acidimicrobiales bacterium]|nr:dethiobiotin synthase [Acidimicrobiales bacterium]
MTGGSSPRPRLLVVVTGTGTEVGKTWVSAALLSLARARGLVVAARKPAQSFGPQDPPSSTDASVLGSATGEPAARVCPASRSYPVAMAPPMAAAALGRPVPSMASLVEAVASSWPSDGCDLGVVEGAGGVASPLAGDGDSADLARAFGPDRVVLVADAGLGTINAVRLSVRALAPMPVIVYLNRFDPGDDLHGRNLSWLRSVDGFAVTCTVEELLGELVGG